MKLHIIAGDRQILLPHHIPYLVLSETIDPAIAPANSNWLSKHRKQTTYHDNLTAQQNPKLIENFALYLRENFGRRYSPFIVLTELALASRNAIQAVHDLALTGACKEIVIHVLTLPPEHHPYPGYESLNTTALRDAIKFVQGTPIKTTQVELKPQQSCFDIAILNIVVNGLATKIGSACWRGFTVDQAVVTKLAMNMLVNARHLNLIIPGQISETGWSKLVDTFENYLEQKLFHQLIEKK